MDTHKHTHEQVMPERSSASLGKHEVTEIKRTLLTLVANGNGQLVFIIKSKGDLTCIGELATCS